MYDNIGGKIKSLAIVICVIEVIAAVIAGIVLIANDDTPNGLLVMFVGPLAAWISSWLLFDFGQLIENSEIIAEEFKRKNEIYEKSVYESRERKRKQRYKEVKAIINSDNVNEDEFIDFACPNCKEELSFRIAQLQSNEVLTCPICDAHITLE